MGIPKCLNIAVGRLDIWIGIWADPDSAVYAWIARTELQPLQILRYAVDAGLGDIEMKIRIIRDIDLQISSQDPVF